MAAAVALPPLPRRGRDEITRAIGLRRGGPPHLLAVGPQPAPLREAVRPAQAQLGGVGTEGATGEATVAQASTQVTHRLARPGTAGATTPRVRAQTVRVAGAHRAATVGVRHADVPATTEARGDQGQVAVQTAPMRRTAANVGAPTVALPPPTAPVVVVREGPATARVAASAGREGHPSLVAHGVAPPRPLHGGGRQGPAAATPDMQLVRHDAVRTLVEPFRRAAPRHRFGLVRQAAPTEAHIVLLVAAGRRAVLPEVADVVEAEATVATVPDPTAPRVALPRETVPSVPTVPVEEAIQVRGLRTVATPTARRVFTARVPRPVGRGVPLKEGARETLGDTAGAAPAFPATTAPLRPGTTFLRRAQAAVGVLPAPGRRPMQVLPHVETVASMQVATPRPFRPVSAAVR